MEVNRVTVSFLHSDDFFLTFSILEEDMEIIVSFHLAANSSESILLNLFYFSFAVFYREKC